MDRLNEEWTTSELISAGLAYTVMGILIVFTILVIIMMVIKAMALLSGEKKPKEVKQPVAEAKKTQNSLAEAPAVAEVPKTDDSELVAVITAAIATMMNEPQTGFVVRSYKKIPGSAWNKAGRREVLDNKL